MKIQVSMTIPDIRQKDLIFDDMGFGKIDEVNCMIENQFAKECLWLFQKEKRLRAIFAEIRYNVVYLILALPTGKEDIIFFYNYIGKLLDTFNVKTFDRNYLSYSRDDIDSLIAEDLKRNQQALEDMTKLLSASQSQGIYITGSRNPVGMNRKTFDSFHNDVDLFADYLSEKQELDYTYVSLKLHRLSNNKITGVYTINVDQKTVFPLEPAYFNNQNQVDYWFVAFKGKQYSFHLPFYRFVRTIVQNEMYDDNCVIIAYDDKALEQLSKLRLGDEEIIGADFWIEGKISKIRFFLFFPAIILLVIALLLNFFLIPFSFKVLLIYKILFFSFLLVLIGVIVFSIHYIKQLEKQIQELRKLFF